MILHSRHVSFKMILNYKIGKNNPLVTVYFQFSQKDSLILESVYLEHHCSASQIPLLNRRPTSRHKGHRSRYGNSVRLLDAYFSITLFHTNKWLLTFHL